MYLPAKIHLDPRFRGDDNVVEWQGRMVIIISGVITKDNNKKDNSGVGGLSGHPGDKGRQNQNNYH